MRLRITKPCWVRKASIGIHPRSSRCEHGWQFSTEPETAAFGYLREPFF